MSDKEPLVPGKHVMIITQVNPYVSVGGVTVVLQNLLSAFDVDSYTFAYLGRCTAREDQCRTRPDCYRLIPNFHPVRFMNFLFKGIKQRYGIARAVRLAKVRNAEIIVGLYPSFGSLHVATEVVKRTKARFFPYLHDTVAEGLSHTKVAGAAKDLQREVFRLAEKVMTMSEGMSDYYRRVYQLETFPLVHSFRERIATEPNFSRTRTAFWGGAVYEINDKSFWRVQQALLAKNIVLEVTSLGKLSIESDTNIRRNFYPSRQDYIQAVQRHGILVLALNWPDESVMHEAELSTIFPTKAIEYLATGSPILIHCPEHYFLARFFRQHQCGVVVSERGEPALARAITFLLAASPEVRIMQERALAASELFSLARVSSVFRDYLKGNVL